MSKSDNNGKHPERGMTETGANGVTRHEQGSRPVEPHGRQGGAGWRTAVLVGAVALGTFSFGHFWGRESALRRDGMSMADGGDGGMGHQGERVAKGEAGASMSAGAPDHTGKQLWTCSMHPQVIQDHPGMCPICHMELTPVSKSAGDGSMVTVDPVVVQNMGVRTAVVAKGALVQSVRAVGYLDEPEPLHRDINLRVSGWIEKLYANIDGMNVAAGEPLFDLYSPELTVAVDEMISARRQLASAPNDETGKTLLDTARRKLTQFGLEEKQLDDLAKRDTAPRNIPILAPMKGHLTAKMVYEGAAVKAGDLVMRIASRHEMWIDAQVYEQQLPLIADGQLVRATVISQPGKVFSGKVMFIHPHLDPQTRTALVRVVIPNEDHALRENMYATVEILADNYREEIVVPREAVIDTGRKQVAFVALGDGKFQPRELTLGAPGQDGTVQVLSGLKVGEQVVTSGQFLLDSESRLREAIAKFGAASSMPGMSHGQGMEKAANATPGMPMPLSSAEASPKPAPTAPMDAMSAPASLMAVPHTDDMVKSYLSIAKALGVRQESEAPVNVMALVDASAMAVAGSQGDAKQLASAVADAASSLKGKPLDLQRQNFVALSQAMVALVRRSKPSMDAVPNLYLMHCPMAFGQKGADWLQDDEAVANPFYASEMKRCGAVAERLQLTK